MLNQDLNPKNQPEEKKKSEKGTPLLEGDIIYEMDDLLAEHAWIYGGLEANVIHSMTGSKVHGVKTNTFKQYGAESDKVLVLRCQNQQLKNLILRIAKGWAPLLTSTQVTQMSSLDLTQDNVKRINVSQQMGIPFTPYSSSRENTSPFYKGEDKQVFNTFYAVRAALRTGITQVDGKPVALSKMQGISCNQFVGYCIQAAAVILLLGENLGLLRDAVDAITKVGLKNLQSKDSLQKFIGLFDDLVTEVKETKCSQALKNQLMDLIEFPVKGNRIKVSQNHFCQSSLFEITIGSLEIQNNLFPRVIKKESEISPQHFSIPIPSATDSEENNDEKRNFFAEWEDEDEDELQSTGSSCRQLPDISHQTLLSRARYAIFTTGHDDSNVGLSTQKTRPDPFPRNISFTFGGIIKA